MKSIALAMTAVLALAVPALAWATPPGAKLAATAPQKLAPETSVPAARSAANPSLEKASTPKGVSPAVWRQYTYDRAPLKLNGPNNGKPLTKMQTQQAQLDKATAGANGQPGVNAVVGQASTIRQVGAEVFNGQSNPVVIKVPAEKVTMGGKTVNAYRLADGNLYYKDPTTGSPTKLGFAAPRTTASQPTATIQPYHDPIARAYYRAEKAKLSAPPPNGMAASLGNR
jgi:hypothetical protein